MSEAISDFMVHIDESLTANELKQLEACVHDVDCVISATFQKPTPHLMMVVYDSECIHAKEILGHVRNNGLHATML